MTILEGTVREEYIVSDIQMEENIMRRLEALGINSGTHMKLMNRKKNGTVIIKVRGTRWAIGKDIAQGIEVTPETEKIPEIKAVPEVTSEEMEECAHGNH